MKSLFGDYLCPGAWSHPEHPQSLKDDMEKFTCLERGELGLGGKPVTFTWIHKWAEDTSS